VRLVPQGRHVGIASKRPLVLRKPDSVDPKESVLLAQVDGPYAIVGPCEETMATPGTIRKPVGFWLRRLGLGSFRGFFSHLARSSRFRRPVIGSSAIGVTASWEVSGSTASSRRQMWQR
jgi:hypothetical protein